MRSLRIVSKPRPGQEPLVRTHLRMLPNTRFGARPPRTALGTRVGAATKAALQKGRGIASVPVTFARLIDAKEAGEMLGVPHTWVLAQARARRIPHHRLGHYVRFDREELQRWLGETRIEARSAGLGAGASVAGPERPAGVRSTDHAR